MNAQAIAAEQTGEFRIYAACLAAYNSGRLHGAWIDLDGKDAAAVFTEINDMLARSPEPNVMRRKCPDCGTYQTDARPYRENDADCDECGATLPDGFKPSAEEWAIHDHEGFGDLIKSEWPDIGDLCELVEFLLDAEPETVRAFHWLINDRGESVDSAIAKAEEIRIYDGEPADYAAEFCEDCYSEALEAMPEFLRHAIDWQAVGRDLVLGGDIAQSEDSEGRFLVTNPND